MRLFLIQLHGISPDLLCQWFSTFSVMPPSEGGKVFCPSLSHPTTSDLCSFPKWTWSLSRQQVYFKKNLCISAANTVFFFNSHEPDRCRLQVLCSYVYRNRSDKSPHSAALERIILFLSLILFLYAEHITFKSSENVWTRRSETLNSGEFSATFHLTENLCLIPAVDTLCNSLCLPKKAAILTKILKAVVHIYRLETI